MIYTRTNLIFNSQQAYVSVEQDSEDHQSTGSLKELGI